jgi:phosphotransferase system IIB component
MKNRLLLIVLIVFYYPSNAQDLVNTQAQFAKNILKNWVKYRVEMKDGSQVLDQDLVKNTASMIIFKRANGVIIVTGRNALQSKYTLIDSVLILDRTTAYIIEKLTEHELIFHGNFPNVPDNEVIRYHYIDTKESSAEYFNRQFIMPHVRLQANGDTAYNFNEYIFPEFRIDNKTLSNFDYVFETSYDVIEHNFNFPKETEGDFRVTFAVDKNGKLKDVVVKESSDSTYNDRLIQAVNQTRKNWLPATHNNKNVEVLFNYVFKFEDETKKGFDMEIYRLTLMKANKQFEKNEYIKAIKLYSKCILMQEKDFDFTPYFKRADSYFALKINKNACLDWSYLAANGQKKAEKLFTENCMK